MSVEYYQSKDKVKDVASPCISHCCLNEDDVCLGCFRNIDEIMTWRKLDVVAKKAVLNQCRQRQQRYGK